VQRLGWKTELIAKFEDRLVQPPLPLPPRVDPDAIHDFDFRRVWAKGRYRHDLEMLVGPRMRDGEEGYMVVTPLERDYRGSEKGKGTTAVLVNRGWVSKKFRRREDRPEGLPSGEVIVEGLLREPWKKNMFTPENRPDKGEFYFPDVKQMAELSGSQAVWVEQTMGTLRTITATVFLLHSHGWMHKSRRALLLLFISWSHIATNNSADIVLPAEPGWEQALDMEAKGIPIGRAAEVNLRNNHAQYIFTWYASPCIHYDVIPLWSCPLAMSY